MTTERDTWLALSSEEPLEPELPICDPHHHLWDYPNNRYLLDALRRDTGSGHRVVSTVFVECESMYRQDGPAPMRPLGETEFVQGIALRFSDLISDTIACHNLRSRNLSFARIIQGKGFINRPETRQA